MNIRSLFCTLTLTSTLLFGTAISSAQDTGKNKAESVKEMISAHGDPFLVVGGRKALLLRGTDPEKLRGTAFSFSGKNVLLVRGGFGKERAFRMLPITFYGTGQELLKAGLTLLDAGDPISITYLNSECTGAPACDAPTCTAVGKTGQQWAKDVAQKDVKGCKRNDNNTKCTATRDDFNKACERTLYTDKDCKTKQANSEADQGGFRCN